MYMSIAHTMPTEWPPVKSSIVEIDNSFNQKETNVYRCRVVCGVGVDVDDVSFHFILFYQINS